MRMICAYRVTTSVSRIMGKRECQARVRWKFGDGTLTCQFHERSHRAALHRRVLILLGSLVDAEQGGAVNLRRKAKVLSAIDRILKEGRCAPV